MARGIPTGNGKRGPVLELAPLELDCMNMLWPTGEATVRDIREALAPVRPRAYTTIMTIMDRLAHKGVVQRRKVGKAYVYRPNLSEEQARAHAVEQVVENYFEGSPGSLASYLSGARPAARRAVAPVRREAAKPAERAKAKEPRAVKEPPAAKPYRPVEPVMDDTLL